MSNEAQGGAAANIQRQEAAAPSKPDVKKAKPVITDPVESDPVDNGTQVQDERQDSLMSRLASDQGCMTSPSASFILVLNLCSTPAQVADDDTNPGDRLVYKSLSRFDLAGSTYNLYNPFRKGAKAGKEDDAEFRPEGLLRAPIKSLIRMLELMNISSVLVAGKPSDRFSTMKAIAQRLGEQCAAEMPLAPDDIVWQAPAEEGKDPHADDILRFGDLVSLNSWLTEPQFGANVSGHDIAVCMTVTSGALQDSSSYIKSIRIIQGMLSAIAQAEGVESTPIYLGVTLDAASLETEGVRTLLDALVQEDGFRVLPRRVFSGDGAPAWAPGTKAEIGKAFVHPEADFMLVSCVSDPDAVQEEPASI